MLSGLFLPDNAHRPPAPASADGFGFPAGPAHARAALTTIAAWPQYASTPLVPLPGMAAELGCGALYYKQESGRFGLGSFKTLGGAYAVQRLLGRIVAERTGTTPTAADLLAGAYADSAAQVTVCCATDGNHGRSVAWGAAQLGCNSVIFIHEAVTRARADAIAALGARVVRLPGTYDDAVRHAQAEADRQGWFVVSDTSYPGYAEIPGWIMQGYSLIAEEIRDQLGARVPTHVFLQAGVGGFAAAIMACMAMAYAPVPPRFITVEPETAACLLASAHAGAPTAVTGDLHTIMAGLACGEPSSLAWPAIHALTDAYLALDDESIRQTMRALARGVGDDSPVIAGESGAAGLAGLREVMANPELAGRLGLSHHSVVLAIGTEGATDPAMYREIVGRDAAELEKAMADAR
ncbi:MAG: diaminopropionate ammonia-lyase [Acetobacter sp.]|uniref:diaminopropionate ammonia-lyase n=1 Tax=Acetobacter sp. TaxID=440 RepID=UPI0039ED69A2